MWMHMVRASPLQPFLPSRTKHTFYLHSHISRVKMVLRRLDSMLGQESILSRRGAAAEATLDIPWRFAPSTTYHPITNKNGLISFSTAENVRFHFPLIEQPLIECRNLSPSTLRASFVTQRFLAPTPVCIAYIPSR